MPRLKKIMSLAVGVALLSSAMAVGLPTSAEAANPYMPEWEHVPDGEPHVFEDPDNPGKERVYVYGSHDTNMTEYCGKDLVLWSAPVDDLTDWRYDGKIFEYTAPGSSTADTFYAPDIAEVDETQPDGSIKKAYYLYPHSRGGGRESMVAKGYSPKGPFEVINWKDDSKKATVGDMGFDPAVFVDDDGSAYGYWGFQRSYAGKLKDNMYQVEPETKITDMIDHSNNDDIWRFFEASSLRKVGDKYVFVYSRKTLPNEGGLGASNSTLAYAYGDTPLGPWTYGGTIVDARGPETGAFGQPITTMPANNTHGSIIEINGQWYVFYHRTVSGAYARQATAEPINVRVTDDGKVEIDQVEITSQGVELDGLDPSAVTSAGIASWVTGGSKIPRIDNPDYPNANPMTAPVTENKNGAIVGYKYFNFDGTPAEGTSTELTLNLTPKGINGIIDVMLDRPWSNADNDGTRLGSISVLAGDDQVATDYKISLSALDSIEGQHAIYYVFRSDSSESIADLHTMQFNEVSASESNPPTSVAIVAGASQSEPTALPLEGSLSLSAAVRPLSANQSVVWTSSDPSVASVSANGTVTGRTLGTAEITVASTSDPSISDSVTVEVTRRNLIANSSFDEGNDPWIVAGAKDDSTVMPNTGHSTRLGNSGRSFNPKNRTYDGDAAQYPLGDSLVAGSTYDVTAHFYYKASENPNSQTTAQFNIELVDADGTVVAVSEQGARETWNAVKSQVVVPEDFDTSSAVLRLTTGDPNAPTAATVVPSFFVDEVYLLATPSSDASLSSLAVLGQEIDVEQAGTAEGATIAVPDPSAIAASDVAAIAADARSTTDVFVGNGQITITVTAQDRTQSTYTVNLERQPILVTGISVTAPATTVKVGTTLQLSATVEPENADVPVVEWSSSDPSVATVDETGLVTAKAKGSVTISATATDGSEATGSIDVQVTEKDTPIPPEEDSVTVTLSQTAVVAGGSITVSGAGLQPNEQFEVWLHSNPVKLGSGVASATGDYSVSVTIPSNTAKGDHRIEVRGTVSDPAFADLQVKAAATQGDSTPGDAASPSDLAKTGFGAAWILWVAIAAAGIGGATLLATRKASHKQ